MAISTIEQLFTPPTSQSQHIEADQFVYCFGDECTHFVLVKRGRIRVEILSTTGHQMLLYRIGQGQSCVITTASLLGANPYSAQAITESATELLLLPKPAFLSLLEESSEFREFVFSGFCDRLSDVISRTTELATLSIDQRLASALLSRITQQPNPLAITHEKLAIEIGTAREVVSRRLSAFEKQKLIARRRGQIEVLDETGLQKLNIADKSDARDG